MESYQFEWSESGLELLKTIQNTIDEKGGLQAYYEAVNEEVNRTCYDKEMRIKLQLLGIIRKYGLPMKDALPILNMTRSQYARFLTANK